jgi:hypothetical protein
MKKKPGENHQYRDGQNMIEGEVVFSATGTACKGENA